MWQAGDVSNALRTQASQAELAIQELQQRQGELDAANEKLETINADLEQLGRWIEKLKDSKTDLTQADELLNNAAANEGTTKKRVEEAQGDSRGQGD